MGATSPRGSRPILGLPRTDHEVVIRQVDNGFAVTIEPPHPDHEPRLFGDRKSARGFSGGVRLVTGWRRRDETEDAGNG